MRAIDPGKAPGTTWQRTARQDTFKCRQYRVARAWQLTVAWIGLCWASSSHLGPLVAGLEQQTSKISVAVVGAGIGGSSASFFLRELVGEDVDIVVFDRADKPGGRTDDFVFDGKTLETGASIIYTGNAHLFNLTGLVGLKRVEPAKQEGPNTGLWDGKQFVLTTTDSGFFNLLKMAWRYGRSLLTVNSMVREALVNFDRIYELQAEGKVFATPEELWGEVDLLDLTKMTIAEYLQKRLGRMRSPVEVELTHAANRVNYNQDNTLNALAGVVSLCPAVTGDLFKVEGGNARLSQELLKASTCQLRLGTGVTGVVGSVKRGYSLYGQGQEKLGTFDAVIIAAPIDLAGISLDVRKEDGGAETLLKPLPLVKFQEVHTTFVRGVVDKSYFGLRPKDAMPSSVLLTEEGAKDSPFSSLALHEWTGVPSKGVGVYKMFSRQELWTGALDSIFVKGSWDILHHREWRAYPVLNPKEDFAPANLFSGHALWYTSSLEEGVSAMEISTIAAKNAALGVAEALLPKLRAHEREKSTKEAASGEASSSGGGDGGGGGGGSSEL